MTNRLIEMTWKPARPVPTRENRLSGEAPDDSRWNGETLSPAVNAMLFRQGIQIGSGRILGFGPQGIRLQTEAEVYKEEYLHVQFKLIENGQQYYLFGHVVNHSPNEIGLLMDVLVPTTRDGLQALLSCSHHMTETATAA
jgi:hypothetical protein